MGSGSVGRENAGAMCGRYSASFAPEEPCPAERMEAYSVDHAVGKPASDGPELLAPAG
jgi:hypothetical protein